MTGKIINSILTVAITVLIAAVIVITGAMYPYFSNMQVQQLKDELTIAATATESLGVDYLTEIDFDNCRITLIRADGTVIYDTKVDSSIMENHLEREEVREALESGRGSASRNSTTLIENTLYEAVRLSDGSVLRISVSQRTAAVMVLGMLQPIAFITIAAIVISIILANRMSKRITEPLNNLDLEHPLENNAYEELSPLLTRIHKQNRQIAQQLKALKSKQDEFKMITENMKEGLILLDRSRHILSINPAAAKVLQTDNSAISKEFLEIDRRSDLNDTIDEAFASGYAKLITERLGREYQFDISAIESGDNTAGAVILCFDVTDTAFAERNRREFTANVSHELKTPLQSIIGSAELLENGLVKPEDTERFIGNIKTEAQRLVTLINDIIRLSQLDENTETPTETIDLYEVSHEVIADLSALAKKRNISFYLEGESTRINGIRRYIYEIIFNLCDNAVRYNREGGSVKVGIGTENGKTVLTVADTGIGIPLEHQHRIFERFYRVDKSHSKQTGGTGLGLSIVKHAVAYHGGEIELESVQGKGTTVKIIFKNIKG